MSSKESDSRKTYILRIASHLVSLNLTEEKLPNPGAFHRFCDTEEQRLVVTRLDSVSIGCILAIFVWFFRKAMWMSGTRSTTAKLFSSGSFFTSNVQNPWLPSTRRRCLSWRRITNKHRTPSWEQSSRSVCSGVERAFFILDIPILLLIRVQIFQVYGDIINSSSHYQANGHIPQQQNGVSGFSLKQELKHWGQESDPGQYTEIMEPLAEKFNQLEQLPLEKCEEFVEIAEFVLDGLWNSQVPYGQSRMGLLIDAICKQRIDMGNTYSFQPNKFTWPSVPRSR